MALILSTLHLIMNLTWQVNCSKGLSSCSLLALWSRYEMHCCHDKSSLVRSHLHMLFTQAARRKIDVSRSAGCKMIIIGGFSSYVVLVSYSSAIKWMLRLMKGGEEEGRGGQRHTGRFFFFKSLVLHCRRTNANRLLYEITTSCSP